MPKLEITGLKYIERQIAYSVWKLVKSGSITIAPTDQVITLPESDQIAMRSRLQFSNVFFNSQMKEVHAKDAMYRLSFQVDENGRPVRGTADITEVL
jgi:hypothetical protein